MSNIQCDSLFPQKVWRTDLDLNCSSIKQYVLNLEKKDQTGNNRSNVNGWQSKSLDPRQVDNKDINKMLESIIHKVNTCASTNNMPELKISNYWFNINRKGGMNASHTHPRSVLSGAFYINSNEKDGEIIFERGDNAQCYLPDGLNNGNFYTSVTYVYPPKINRLYIFGSWMTHWVRPNTTNSDRISLSFNTHVA